MKFLVIAMFFASVQLPIKASAAQAMPVVSMKKHHEIGLTCEDCHKTENPVKKPKKTDCLECHGNTDGIYEGAVVSIPNFPERKVNFHDSHYGQNIRCTKCHAYHKEPRLACNDCHHYESVVK